MDKKFESLTEFSVWVAVSVDDMLLKQTRAFENGRGLPYCVQNI